jgi:hypothetical protein
MPFCSGCGQTIAEDAKFCAACGRAKSGAVAVTPSGAAAAPALAPEPPVTRVVIVEPKRGGRLALKSFFLAVILGAIFTAALKDSSGGSRSIGMAISTGVAAAYIITNLRKWKKANDIVKGQAIAWTIAVLLLMSCLGSVVGSTGSGSTSNSTASMVSPRDAIRNGVKLDYSWEKSGFGSVMVADFTFKNPTPYRFKDVEVTCNHFASSGTKIDSNTRTIYEIVEPKSTKVVKNMNMGFMASQVATSSCEITDFVVLQ